MSEWKKVKLGEVITLQRGYDLPKSKFKKGNVPVITSTSVMGYHDIAKEKGPGVITGRSGTIGQVQYVESDYWPHNTSLFVKDFKGNNPKFIYYFLKDFDPSRAMTGSAVPTLNRNNLAILDVIIPPLTTQHRIATILSRYDSLIENYQKQIKLLEEAAQRLYKEWFINLHFPGHENTPIINGVPEGWEKKKLGEIAEVVMGSSPKSEFYNTEKQGLPFHQGVGSYGARFVEDNVYSTAITRLAEPNSILFSVRAPVGRLNITKNKIIIGRGLAAMNHKQGCQSFLFYMLKERFYKDNIIGNGSIFASISKDDLLSQMFIVPNDDILKRFESFVSKIDNNITDVDTQLRLLTEARDRLLPKLMSGEIEV